MKFRNLVVVGGALALLGHSQIWAQSFVDYTGGTYFQNFDSLIYSNNTSLQARDPATINGAVYTFNGGPNGVIDFAATVDSSGTTNTSTGGLGLSSTMPGWYGSAAVATKYGAQAGAESQGGIYNFGALTSTNRALGLESANGSGITTFGLKLVNDTGADLTTINLSFLGELWRGGAAKSLNFSFLVTNTTASLPLSGGTSLGSFGFTAGANNAVDGTASINQTNINLTGISVGNWQNGQALWLTWQTSSAGGSAEGLAIDNLSLSTVAVPEASTIVLVGLGLMSLLGIRRRRQ